MKLLPTRFRSASHSITLFAALALFSTGCHRNEGSSAPAASAPAAPTVAPLVAQASNLGFAGKMPADLAFYFGSANLKSHIETLRKTTYWKSVEAFVQDHQPSGDKAAAAKAKEQLENLENGAWEEFFFAMGAKSDPAMKWLIDLNRVYGEYTYRTLITGFAGGSTPGSGMDLANFLKNASASPELVGQICDLLDRAELPPLLAGMKHEKAKDLLALVLPPEKEKRAPWLAQLKEGQLQLEDGSTMTTYEGKLSQWLTPEVRAQELKNLSAAIKDPTILDRIGKTLEKLAAKTFAFGIAENGHWLLVAAGSDLSHMHLAKTPSDSLLTIPDLAVAAPHAGSGTLGLFHAKGSLLNAMHDETPIAPMLEGAVKGFAGLPVFSALAAQLQPKVEALTAAEKAFYHRTFTNASGVFWWDKGLHMDAAGGVTTEGLLLKQPLKFSALLDMPDAVFVSDGHSPASIAGRAYFERWMDLIYSIAGGLIQAGLGGDQALGIYALLDKGVIPPVVKIYDASKTLYQKGLGTESAAVVDFKGAAPLLPGAEAPPTAPGKQPAPWVPRISGVHDILNREAIGTSWQAIETNLNLVFKALPTPMPPMTPISSDKDGLTTWFYPLPIGGNDLLPCVSLNDQIFMLGTSKNLHESIAAQLKKQPATTLTGTHYRLRFAPLKNLLKNADAIAIPGVPTAEAQTAVPWLAPFGELRGKTWEENGVVRNAFDWDISEPRKVD